MKASPSFQSMTIEEISKDNVSDLAQLVLYLWPECNYKEEFQNGLKILKSKNETAFIAKNHGIYLGFIQLSLRHEYVEGTSSSPVLYMEGIYVDPSHRKEGIAKKLVEKAQLWGKTNGCTEMASDSFISNKNSIDFHQSVGFEEVSRLVTFKKKI
ncbi:aminoglycoside 6'-N-acetyltransferase [Ekhidna sp.]|uniref:aminoglycoside 6'-N-acetyltransferase n=1 Tax=Ekhidna sp. TaxID=2608089 RepID=UPI003CCBBAAB